MYFCNLKNERGVAQLASVLAWGARGRKFESSHPDVQKKVTDLVTFFRFTLCGKQGRNDQTSAKALHAME